MTDARQLSRRERQIMDIVYRRGQATAADVIEDMPDPPSYSAVRSVLRILQEKGHLRHEQQGRRYVFRRRRGGPGAALGPRAGGPHLLRRLHLRRRRRPARHALVADQRERAGPVGRTDRAGAKGRPVAMDPLQTVTVLTDPTWLADAAVRSAALLAGAGLLATGAHRAPAAMRHLIWAVALATSLALPAVSGRMPSITMVVPESLASLVARPASVIDPPSAATAPPRTPPPPEHADSTATATRGADRIADRVDDPARRVATRLAGRAAAALERRRVVRDAAIHGRARNGLVHVAGGRDHRRSELAAPRQRLVRSTRPARTVRLLRSERANVPMTWGWSRPVVLLPADADDWPVECRTAVLAHELAHVQRRDCAIQAMAQLACAVYWFNPLVWLAARRLRVERERACDDQVLTMGMRPSDYAKHLLNIAHSQPMEWAAAATMAMARRSELEGRIMAILDPEARRVIPRAVRILTASTVVILALALAAVEPSGYAPQSDRAADPAGPVPARRGPGRTPSPTTTRRPGGPASGSSRRSSRRWPIPTPPSDGRRRARSDECVASGRVDALARALGADSDAEVRSAAARALGRARRSEAAAALAGALDDADAEVRRQAAWALGNIRSREAVQALVAALRDTIRRSRTRRPGPGHHPGSGRDGRSPRCAPERRRRGASAGGLGPGQHPEPRGGQRTGRRARRRGPGRAAAGRLGLGNIRDASAVDGLIAALSSAADDARQQAAWALGNIRAGRAVDGLVAALRDTDGDVQQQAAWALGNIRDARAVDGLVEALGKRGGPCARAGGVGARPAAGRAGNRRPGRRAHGR